MKITDITKEDDFTNVNTVKYVIRKIKFPGDIFFYCSPCTGGSTWQRLNLELAKRKGWNNTIVKLIDHWDLHRKLWESFEQVAKHCRTVGATVLLEWPRFCSYWQEKRVSQFSKTCNSFTRTLTDACTDLFQYVKVQMDCQSGNPGVSRSSIPRLTSIFICFVMDRISTSHVTVLMICIRKDTRLLSVTL